MARKKGTKSVLVVGLGRFGSSVASTLNEMEQDVLAVDKDRRSWHAGRRRSRWCKRI